jgi:hypothetical protein
MVKAKTIDELIPMVREPSIKIIKALAPVISKYLIVKDKKVINRKSFKNCVRNIS